MSEGKSVLEREQRFSESLLWKMQKKAYGQLGPNAWGQGPVPLYITSNPFLAREYAAVAYAFLRDWQRTKGFDLESPIYFLDLGAGCGRFGYLFTREIRRLIAGHPQLKELEILYVLTEIVPSTVEYWSKHELLKPLFAEGVMEYAQFNAEEDESLRLQYSDRRLQAEDISNPVIGIANYLYDTVTQDLYRVQGEQLQEGRVTLSVARDGVRNVEDPDLIDELQFQYHYENVETSPWESESIPARVLQHYRSEFTEAVCCLPTAGYRVLENLQRLSNGRCLMLSGDQGIARKDQVARWGDPKVSLHGTFSVPVDYYALGLFFDLQDGAALRSRDHDQDFVVLAGVLGIDEKEIVETRIAFDLVLCSFEPQNYWALLNCVEEECKDPSLDLILALLKLGNWDPPIFHAFFNQARKQAPKATEAQKDKLCRLMTRVAENFYPLTPEEGAFFTSMGIVCFEMQRFSDAISFFARTLVLQKEFAPAWFYMGMCYKFLGDLEKSVGCLQRARKIDPSLPET